MKIIKTLLVLVIGTLILSIIGLYNGYPLVHSDTGTYISSGFNSFIPNDRPVTYGLFIRLFSFNYSLWFIIIFQNFITAFVIYEVLKTMDLNKERFIYYYLSVLTFLVLFTGIGWYSNQIMPDFFAPISILIIFVLLKKEKISLSIRVVLYLILIYSLISHLSHLMIGSVLILLVVILKYTLKQRYFDIPVKRIINVLIIVCSSWIILPGINYLVEKKFILSKASHVFIMAHLNDTGILEKFLKENCSDKEFEGCKLCHYKDSLPNTLASFIWSTNILENTGGWLNSKEEYNKIIAATLKQPKYLFLNIFKSFNYGLIQLTKNEIGQGLSPYLKGSPPYGQINVRFHDELNNYLNSRQNKWKGGTLRMNTLNTFNLIILMSSLFIIIYLFATPVLSKLDSKTVTFLLFVILAIIINSFVTAGLNSPTERFQARVIWMLPLALIILVSKNFDLIIKAVNDSFNNKRAVQ
jgi:hypothetical protein